MSELREIGTPFGPARAHLDLRPDPPGLLVLGHGAGGGIQAPDLLAAQQAALGCEWAVVRVEQPYRVAGRRSPGPARQLDLAWEAVLAGLGVQTTGLTLVLGGRSSGARVGCRTAGELGADGVLCLAFPLQPPARRGGSGHQMASLHGAPPPASRLGELEAVSVPVLVVQGRSDRFGVPPAGPRRQVVVLEGDHGLKRDLEGVRAAVAAWLPALVSSQRSGRRESNPP